MTYKVTEEFLKTFGLKNLQELPELPKFKLDSNRQIVIDEIPVDSDKQEAEEFIDKALENK